MTQTTSNSELHVILGTGPVGRAIAHALTNRGARVRIVSRSGQSDNLPVGIELCTADLTKIDDAENAMSEAAAIYHCAAPAYEHWVRDFPTLQKGIVAGAGKAGAPLVMLDNLYGYGVAGTLTEDMPLSATGPKGRLRADMARELLTAHDSGQIKATIARAADFIGPHARMTALGDRFWPNVLNAKTVQWFGDPDAPHSFTYLPDLANAMIQLGTDQRALGRAWHVPSLPATPVRQIAERVAEIASVAKPKVTVTPKLMMRIVGLFVPAARELIEVGYQFNDRFDLGWSAYADTFGGRPTDLDTILRTTIDWWQRELAQTPPKSSTA